MKSPKHSPAPPREPNSHLVLGWREYVELPDLGIDRIKAKIDSGARSCALHAINIRYYQKNNSPWVSFVIHPRQKDTKSLVACHAPLLEVRSVKDSGGKRTLRPVIMTQVRIGQVLLSVELTLVARDSMGFRMLIGRQAIRGHYLIDPGKSYVMSQKKKKKKSKKTQARISP